jgi:hypothetical protein
LPLWARWAIPFAVAAAVVIALVEFVNYETNDVSAIAGVSSPKAVAEEYREDTILVRQQQAPHVATLGSSQSAAAGIHAAVVGYMTHEINVGSMDGPIRSSSCVRTGGPSSRQVFHCQVTASAQQVTYPFDGVVEPASGVITYCQRVAPPVPSMNVPVSRRCT